MRKNCRFWITRSNSIGFYPSWQRLTAFFFTGSKILKQLTSIQKQLTQSSIFSVTKTQVADLHASTSCLKSFCTSVAADGIEDCRKSCGGHGFLQASGLPELLGSYLQNPTVEGDNHMLPQQAVGVLLKLVKKVIQGDETVQEEYKGCDSEYLIAAIQNILSGEEQHFTPTNLQEIQNLDVLLSAFRHRSARLLLTVAQELEEKLSSLDDNASMQSAWNDSLIQMHRISCAHALSILLFQFQKGINEAKQQHTFISEKEVNVLTDLAHLFALYWMERNLGDFMEDGYISSSQQAALVRNSVLALLKKVRPNAVALVDAHDISDFRLNSALGRYDGMVYEAIMESARRDPLNRTEPGPGYEHLRKMYVDGVGVAGTVSRL